MNRAYLFYGWKVDAGLALRYLEAEDEDMTHWFFTEVDDNVFLTHACPASGLNLFECDFYVVMGQPHIFPHDPDDLFDLLRDRELLERAWKTYRRLQNLPDGRFQMAHVYPVVHFY